MLRLVKYCLWDIRSVCPRNLPSLGSYRMTKVIIIVFGLIGVSLLCRVLFWLLAERGRITVWRWEDTQTFYAFNDLTIRAEIVYFMFGTTLLGSWRHHGLLPGENVMQVAVAYDRRRDLKAALSRLAPAHILQTKTPYRWTLLSSARQRWVSSHVQRPVHVDIIFYSLNSTHLYTTDPVLAKKGLVFPKDQIFPVTFRPFQDGLLPAPNDTLSVLNATYTLDLCEVAPCLDLVEGRASSCLETPCQLLRERYPFTRRLQNLEGECEELLFYGWVQIDRVTLDQSRGQC